MPRQRMVKPEFFDSESIGACSIAARLAFIGLWVTSDDYGNQKLQIGRIRRSIFPYDAMDDGEFMALLCELEAVGCIKGYESDGCRYINVPNFSIYQTVNRPSKSSSPKPPKCVSKAKRTTALREWSEGGKTITDGSLNTHGVSECSHTTHPERKKERKKEVEVVVSQQQLLQGDSAEHGADAVETAPRSAHACPECGNPMERTNAKASGTDRRYWRCAECGKEAVYG